MILNEIMEIIYNYFYKYIFLDLLIKIKMSNSTAKIKPQFKKMKSLKATSKKSSKKELLNLMEEKVKFLKEKSKDKIVNFFRNNKELFKLKQRIIILRILKQRQISAQKIQNSWKKYQLYLKVHKLAHHVHGCYTISPTMTNVTKIYIKIYTTEFNTFDFKIIPLRYCPIRKSFIIDIPKNKFCGIKKILHFNFLYKDEVFFDDNYKKIFFIDDYVHELNLANLDKKQELLDNKYNKFILKFKSLKDYSNSTDDESPLYGNLNFKFDSKNEENSDSDKNSDEYAGLRPINKMASSKVQKKIKYNLCRKFESCDSIDNIGLISILKNSNNKQNTKKVSICENQRKVSFGTTQYSY